MRNAKQQPSERTPSLDGMEGEKWQMSLPPGSLSYQTWRELLARVVPVYQTASPAHKHLILNDFVKVAGYARKSAICLLNHPPSGALTIRRPRLPIYGVQVQQALLLAWKAAHYVCAKRLVPALPTLIALLEHWGYLHLSEEHRRQVLAMSVSTAERYLRTQRKPRLHGLSTTTPGSCPKRRSRCARSLPGKKINPASSR